MRKSLDSTEKGSVYKMSEKCPKIVWRGWQQNFRIFFWINFAYLVDAFIWWSCPMLAHYNNNLTRQSIQETSANQTKERPIHVLSRGQTGTKVRCESRLFAQGKHQYSQKGAKFMKF